MADFIEVRGASQHNLKNVQVNIPRGQFTVITGVSGSGKSSLAFDTILAEAQRRFFYTLSQYTRQFLDLGARPKVLSITGLSPAISLAQNETQPSPIASVGSFSNLGELLGVLLARTGERFCPEHGLPTTMQTPETIVSRIIEAKPGAMITIAIPVARQKKGSFQQRLNQLVRKGFSRAMVDGSWLQLQKAPELAKDEKHDISVAVDQLRAESRFITRLQKSLVLALEEGGGVAELWDTADDGRPVGPSTIVSTHSGCPACSFSWPALEPRDFSSTSTGRCTKCMGKGQLIPETDSDADEGVLEPRLRYYLAETCSFCLGTGIRKENNAIQLGGLGIHQLAMLPLAKLQAVLESWMAAHSAMPLVQKVAGEAVVIIRRLNHLGLEHLNMARRLASLSGGEMQRLRLAGIVGENLRGVLYVLDEPSQGLHPSEVARLTEQLRDLCLLGNTVLAVDHDLGVLGAADWIVDLGPGGGELGGEIVAQFAPNQAERFRRESLTARALASDKINMPGALMSQGEVTVQSRMSRTKPAASIAEHDLLSVVSPRLHNLSCDRIDFAMSKINMVGGVTGAGKSSLIYGVIFANLELGSAWRQGKEALHCAGLHGRWKDFAKVLLVDRRPLAKSSSSMPATYLDVYGELRQLYCSLAAAQIAGLTPRDFSLATGNGRCPECGGRGEIVISMRFLADAHQECPVCRGQRFQMHVLGVRYAGLNMYEVLELSIQQALEHFRSHSKIVARLQRAVDLGLGYLKLGQPTSSLSGGEAQRLKLASLLFKGGMANTLLLMDEPTRGLHHHDTGRLLSSLRQAQEAGATLIIIEHSIEVLQASDWLVELGSLQNGVGGELLYQGAVGDLQKSTHSLLAREI